MCCKSAALVVHALVFMLLSSTALARDNGDDERCLDGPGPVYSNVEVPVVDISDPQNPQLILIKGVLTQPVKWVRISHRRGCFVLVEEPPAVVILHGSAGMDARNTFYGRVLQHHYATLSIEMFEAGGRPPLPQLNVPFAFGALKYLVDEVGADPDAIGCLGFSWGGVICNQAATVPVSELAGDLLYGTGYRFAAHVANYPVCWARNIGFLGIPPGSEFGRANGGELTGAPLLIQVGSEDAYDNLPGQSGSQTCKALRDSLEPDEQELVHVVVFEGGHHAFDRVFAVPEVVRDPFARLGAGLLAGCHVDGNLDDCPEVALIPDQDIANKSLLNVLRFLRRTLRY